MLYIENKRTGEVIETATNNWRNGLNYIKISAAELGINTKASDLINNLKNGYEDRFIKAYLKEVK